MKRNLLTTIALALFCIQSIVAGRTFVHPGISYTQAESRCMLRWKREGSNLTSPSGKGWTGDWACRGRAAGSDRKERRSAGRSKLWVRF